MTLQARGAVDDVWPRSSVLPWTVLVWAALAAAIAAAPARAQTFTCGDEHLGTEDGCDCGCGALDPDCGAAPIALSRCDYDGCAAGLVPSGADPTVCVANACGDGYVGGGEACDDGNTTDDGGCAPDCTRALTGWLCGPRGEGCRRERCGDGLRTASERCDDGNAQAGDGCAPDCTDEPGFVCYEGQPCRPTFCGDLYADYDPYTRTGETCDDGNNVAGDGCDDCEAEPGWYCPLWGGTCMRSDCGNGVVEGDPYYRVGETCDDMNDDPNDGCDQCVAAPDAICWSGPCHYVACGDGIIDNDGVIAFEACDDGNATGNDGCSGTCQLEPGYDCISVPPGQPCVEVQCGDGILSYDQFGYYEACDDGNEVGGDGCDANCSFVEQGFICDAPGQPCREPVCGDGFADRDPIWGTIFEECDDGNTASGDGCSSSCEPEPGFECITEGQPCIDLPAGWVCSGAFFGAGDGCDCGCGRADPDCDAATESACDFNHCFEEPQEAIDPCDPSQCVTAEEAEEARCSVDGGDDDDIPGAPPLRCDEHVAGRGAPSAALLLLVLVAAAGARPRPRRTGYAARATDATASTAGR